MNEKNFRRTLVLGDIHGAKEALLQVLSLSKFDNELDRLIFLGDVADGWHEVPECVDILLNIKNLVCIRGNHDIWLRDWLKSDYDNPMWRPQGGQASYDAYLNKLNYMTSEDYESWKEKHIDFFENQVDYYIDENNNLYTHGGWDYGWKSDFLEAGLFPINGGNPQDNIAKECHWSRELFYGFYSHSEKGLPKKLKEATEKYNKIFVGHTSLKYPYKPFHKANFYNIDTGAGWNGKLTIMDVETDEYWQSSNVSELYPGKNGRR